MALLGIPDILMCCNGHFVALELKKDEYTEASKLQRWVLAKIIKAGGVGLVLEPSNFEQVYFLLKKVASGEMTLKAEALPDLAKLNS